MTQPLSQSFELKEVHTVFVKKKTSYNEAMKREVLNEIKQSFSLVILSAAEMFLFILREDKLCSQEIKSGLFELKLSNCFLPN